ncbi:hypothetical protein NL676_027836 [Syzygium grande]|nr:hypothetical protein NL676_027836 [Syzygium grande]
MWVEEELEVRVAMAVVVFEEVAVKEAWVMEECSTAISAAASSASFAVTASIARSLAAHAIGFGCERQLPPDEDGES